MATFTNAEYADILFTYGRADGNARLARRLYAERYPGRRLPNVQVFINTYRRICDNGTVHHREPGVRADMHDPGVEELILDEFQRDGTTSIRKVAMQLNLSQWKVWSVLQSDGQHPFHYTPVQGLDEGDPVRRILFCRFLLDCDAQNGRFLKSILWTDESKFTREGITNFHNLHYWSREHPHLVREISFQQKFSVNVWAGVIGRTLIGPYYVPDTLNGDNYLEFLQNNLDDILDEVPLDVRREIIYQHDGCPAHYRNAVRDYLTAQFPNRWIGRNGPMLWPARSPDLTPLDYYVWGRAKQLVYEVSIQTRNQLIHRIDAAFIQMKQEMRVGTTTTQMRKRARLCIRNGGRHFENVK